MILLTIIFSMSICTVICGTPFVIYKLHTRATKDKDSLSRKVGQIKLLPKVCYNRNYHTSMTFCTICMDNFKNAKSQITYLPCDARHYFHTKCVSTWLLLQNSVCPLCKIPVNFKKSIEHDQ